MRIPIFLFRIAGRRSARQPAANPKISRRIILMRRVRRMRRMRRTIMGRAQSWGDGMVSSKSPVQEERGAAQ